jgi:putative DNA primase/helicase
MVAHAQAPAETERPRSLPLPAIDALPAELRARPQWVAVRLVPKGDGKLDKVPVDPASGRNADAGNPATWGTVEAAHAHARHRGLGIGYVFSEDDPFTGVDKDGCRDPETGELTPDAFILLGRLATYAEASISGRGIHAIARATKPGPRCRRRRGDLEIYDRLRLFAFSGAHLVGTPRAVMPRQAEVTAVYEDEFGEPELLVARPAPRPVATDDAALIERARAARDDGRFDRLWRGDDADHGGNASDADYHFCRSAAFWTGGDAARIDAWYRASGRTRPKWDERRGATTYGAMTIKAALASQRTFYDPEGRAGDACAPIEPTPAAGGCPGCAARDRTIAELREWNQASAMSLQNKELKKGGRGAIGIAKVWTAHRERGDSIVDPKTGKLFVHLPLGEAGGEVGYSDDTMADVVNELHGHKLLEKKRKYATVDKIDRETGEKTQKRVRRVYVHIPDESGPAFLRRGAAFDPQKPPEERHGGYRPKRCEEHPEAPIKVTTLRVEECGVCEGEIARTEVKVEHYSPEGEPISLADFRARAGKPHLAGSYYENVTEGRVAGERTESVEDGRKPHLAVYDTSRNEVT